MGDIQELNRTKLPEGFTTSGVNCGVRKYRPDMGLIKSDRDCVTVGVFTKNINKAACVKYGQSILPASNIRYLVANSGQANAATGEQGDQDNLSVVKYLAKKAEVDHAQVLISSTGIIGVPLELEKLYRGIDELLIRGSKVAEPFATAILTTDLVPKTVYRDVELSSGTIRLSGICKGSGMIHPNMATMLAYILTDADVPVDKAQELLSESVEDSFNMISVDGETSTNDSCFFMANGASGVSPSTGADWDLFREAVIDMCQRMAKSIVSDGEGATKIVEVNVQGCADLEIAREAARGITSSPLIKAAIHGEDPNWGRIYSRLGQYGMPIDHMDKLDLDIQGVSIVEKGRQISIDYYQMKVRFKEEAVAINMNFHSGPHSATAWGCDLSKRYVDINTEYN